MCLTFARRVLVVGKKQKRIKEMKHYLRKITVFVLAGVMLAASILGSVSVQAATVYATSVADDGSTVSYGSIGDAWTAAMKGTKITLQCDWKLGSWLEQSSNTTVTIEMNGHKIYRSLSSKEHDGSVINMKEGSTLNLLGEASPKTTIKFKGWKDNKYQDLTVENGGLITGGWSQNGAGGIQMAKNCSVTLDNVAVAGNYAQRYAAADGYGGGVLMDGESGKLTLKNGARIDYNKASYGGGVSMGDGEDKYNAISMDNSSISYNYAESEGGGIYCDFTQNTIDLTNNSKIDHNSAEDGGGIYFFYPQFVLRSTDATGSVSHNRARSDGGQGGAVYMDSSTWRDYEGTVTGITFEDNSSDGEGGAIYINQKKVVISNCIIKDNASGGDGGGIFIKNGKSDKANTVSACKVTGNTSNTTGGGIYVDSLCDVTLSGTVVIKDNKRKNDSVDDDLYLQDGSASTAYIYGSPSGNSEIGVRTDGAKEFKVGKGQSFYNTRAFFYDYDKTSSTYVFKHVDSGDGELWIKKRTKDDIIVTTKTVEPDVKAYGKYNDQTLYKGYFSYPSVVESTEDLSSVFYYSDGYFLSGSEDANAGDPTVYNTHLASMSMCMALAGFYSQIGNDGTYGGDYDMRYTYKSQNIEKLFNDIGIDADDIYISDSNTVKPTTTSIGVAIGQKSIRSKSGEYYILVPIAMRGAGYESEWYGNATVGEGHGNGEHEGFALAADKVMTEVQNYIKNYNLENAVKEGKVKFWIAGYSRGGAVSNLTAKRLIDAYGSNTGGNETKNQVYAYCFEAPKGGYTGYDGDSWYKESRYYSIHNCINKVDVVPLLAPSDMGGFTRYGVDHYIPGSDAYTYEDSSKSGVSTDTKLWSINNWSFKNVYQMWYDNESFTVGSDSYNTQKTKMLKQLAAVDPTNITFYDGFTVTALNYAPSPSFEKLSTDGEKLTQEEFLLIFVRALQAWGFYGNLENNTFRSSYATYSSDPDQSCSLQATFQTLTKIFYGKSNEDLNGLMEGISAGINSIGTLKLIEIWKTVIGEWSGMSTGDKYKWSNYFWTVLMMTKPIGGQEAYKYLTADELSAVQESWFTLIDVAMRFVEIDYETNIEDWNKSKSFDGWMTTPITDGITTANTGYTSRSQVILGTLINNVSSIAQGHYPEINFAWIRSYDSFYDSEEYDSVKVETDETPEVEATLSGNSLCLEADIEGAGVYYRMKEGDGDYSVWKPFNKDILLESKVGKSTTYTVQMTAVYCNNTSEVVTKTYDIAGSYKVTVNGTEIGTYRAGTKVTIDGKSTDTSKVFKSWADPVTSDGSNVKLADKTSAVTTFTMPEADIELTALYSNCIGNVTLTVDKPVAGKAFATEGTLSWIDADTEKEVSVKTDIQWVKVTSDGTSTVTGNAEYNTTYAAQATVAQDKDSGRIFASDMTNANVKVVYGSDAAQEASSAKVEEDGTLSVQGSNVTTAKAKITDVPVLNVNVLEGTSEDDFLKLLPDSVTVETEDGERTVTIDKTKADTDAVIKDGVVTDTDGNITVPLNVPDDIEADESKKDVTFCVMVTAKEPVATPTISLAAGTYNEDIEIELGTTTENAKIYYKINDGNFLTYTGAIKLAAVAGTKQTYSIYVYAAADGYANSTATTAVYVVDDPFTISINGKDTGFKSTGLWENPVKINCYKGDSITITPPAEEDELFEKWESVPTGASVDESGRKLTVNSVSGDMDLTAVYNPVINELSVDVNDPVLGRELAEKLTKAEVEVTNKYDVTQYFSEIEWTPGDVMPSYNTAYTAKLKTNGTENMKFILSDNLDVDVNDGESDVKATVAKENGEYVLYMTFPKTAKADLQSVTNPDDATVSRENAAAGNWNLPKTTTIQLSDGNTETVSILWSAVPGFDPENTGAQTSTITGKISLPDYVDAGEISTEVSMTVTIPAMESVMPPTADLESGKYEGTQYVRLSCETEGAELYYTLDDTTPTTESTKYDGSAIVIDETVKLNIIAVKDGMLSSTASYSYEITKSEEPESPSDEPESSTDEPESSTDEQESTTISPSENPTTNNNSDNNKSDNNKNSSDKKKAEKTGDENNMTLWLITLAIGGAAIASTLVYRNKLNRKRK